MRTLTFRDAQGYNVNKCGILTVSRRFSLIHTQFWLFMKPLSNPAPFSPNISLTFSPVSINSLMKEIFKDSRTAVPSAPVSSGKWKMIVFQSCTKQTNIESPEVKMKLREHFPQINYILTFVCTAKPQLLSFIPAESGLSLSSDCQY